MSVLVAGTVVGYDEKLWKMTGDDGVEREGITRTLTLSTGDGTEQVKFSDDTFEVLTAQDRARLSQFGRPAVVRCTSRANAYEGRAATVALSVTDLQWVTLADVRALGFCLDVYDPSEDDDVTSNGHLASV